MAWTDEGDSDSLTLDENYDTILQSSSAWEIALNPGELAACLVKFDPEATPSENLDIVFLRSHDGTTFETEGKGLRYIISFDEDPGNQLIQITGCQAFKMMARVRDTDDTDGTDDIASAVIVEIETDGVSL